MPFTYLTFAQAKTQLASRLYDTSKVFWADAEIGLYIIESLRTWNALTAYWVDEFEFTYPGFSTSPGTAWLNASTLTGSPRPYVIQNTDLYSIILYHLLEPQLDPVTGLYVGTQQFSLDDLVNSLTAIQNEVLSVTRSNLVRPATIPLTPNTRKIDLPDNFLEVVRAKYVPPATPPGYGAPQVLWRGDAASFAYFTPAYIQTRQNPRNYALSDIPPLTLEVDFPPPNPGVLDLLVVQSATVPAPPATATLSVPTDWAWVIKWGVLMDLLDKQSEARDPERAEYAKARYMEGLSLLQSSPWLLAANIENVPVGIESVMERDTYNPGWEYNDNARQGIVVAGLDTFALSPLVGAHPTVVPPNTGVVLTLVENAPVPAADADTIQVTRDTLDVILDYAEHLAMFKCGGAEFADSTNLFDNFRKAAMAANKRIANLGLFDDVMKKEGRLQEEVDTRA